MEKDLYTPPPGSRRSMSLRQAHVAQGGLQTLANDATVAKPNLIDASKTIRANTVPNTIDHEDANAGQRQKALASPLLNALRRYHCQRSERTSVGVREDAAE